jgi:serine/threonine-protein kinase
MMRWGMALGRPVSEAQVVRLQQLARCSETHGRGLRWPWRDSADGEESYIGGWCNGSAGFVHLWLLAHRLTAADDYVDLARGAAWHAWEHEDWEQSSLCCGLAGRAYALLALYRATQEREWLRRARELAYPAVELVSLDEPNAYSLYRGVVGVALLLEELERPHLACMPMFEPEGW